MLPLLCTSLASSQLRKVRFKIDAGTAPLALAEFVRQTGLQVLFETDAIRNHTTQAVVGQFEAAEALSLMLQGSGLVFEFVNDRTITVRPQPPAQTLPAAARPAAFFRSL